MVRVLANGEIDGESNPRQRAPPPPSSNRNQQSRNQEENRTAQGSPSSPSELFNYVNQRLLSFGLPHFPVGDYILEPLHLLLAVLSLVFFGPMALIAVCLIIYVTQQGGGDENTRPEPIPPQNQPASSPRATSAKSDNKLFAGSGQRLGS